MLGPPLLPQKEDRIMYTLTLEVVCLRGPDKEAFQKCVNLNKNKNKKRPGGEAKGKAVWAAPKTRRGGGSPGIMNWVKGMLHPHPDGCA